jgi:flagellar hook-associated protein 1 FlgK
MDRRDAALTTLSRLTGATARPDADGTVDVVVDGNPLVQGGSSRRLAVAGATTISDAAADPVRIVWADRPTVPATPDGGELAARVATLAGPNADGTGGTYAEAAKAYDTLATTIATAVNAVHRTGSTPSGTTGVDFFSVGTTAPAALGLGVVPTSVAGIAAGNAAKGPADGSVADAIAQLGQGAGAPDAAWSAFVSRTAVATNALNAQATVAEQSSSAALTAQTSQSGVDLDEETSNLVVFQHAYQGAARVLTAVDEMLDTLINKTGLVGR